MLSSQLAFSLAIFTEVRHPVDEIVLYTNLAGFISIYLMYSRTSITGTRITQIPR